MEKGHSFLEVIIITAIICITSFAGLDILLKTINIKRQSSSCFFLTSMAEEKMREIKEIIKKGKNLESSKDYLKDPFTQKKVLRIWEIKEDGEMIEIKVTAYSERKRIEISDYFWKKGGF